jgi:hypothetical protein
LAPDDEPRAKVELAIQLRARETVCALTCKRGPLDKEVGSMHLVSRVALAPMAVITMAVFSLAGSAAADPPPTQVITTVAVGPNGQPINGYQEAPSEGNVAAVDDCTTPSPSAVANNIYSCSPSAASAGTCWPSTPGSLLCVVNPWDKRLYRVTYGSPLPPVQPTAIPEPFAMLLDDGTHCLIRNGGSWGGRDDGYVGTLRQPRRKPGRPVAAQPGPRDLHRPLNAGVDGQARPTGHTDHPLPAAPDPRGDRRLVRRELNTGQPNRVGRRPTAPRRNPRVL